MTRTPVGDKDEHRCVVRDWEWAPTPGAPPTPGDLAELADVAAEQRGLVTRGQCLSAGLTDSAVEWRLARGRWSRVHRGVYLTTPGRDDWWTGALAAHLFCGPQAAWSHGTAGYAYGLVRREPRLVEILVPHHLEIVGPSGVRVRRSRHLDERADPMRWPWRTTVEETVLDLAERGSVDDVFAVLGRGFQRGLTTEEALLRRSRPAPDIPAEPCWPPCWGRWEMVLRAPWR